MAIEVAIFLLAAEKELIYWFILKHTIILESNQKWQRPPSNERQRYI